MQSVMNLKIKFRESFRPFAPMVLQEDAAQWSTLEPGVETPYKLLVAHVQPERRVADDLRGLINDGTITLPAEGAGND